MSNRIGSSRKENIFFWKLGKFTIQSQFFSINIIAITISFKYFWCIIYYDFFFFYLKDQLINRLSHSKSTKLQVYAARCSRSARSGQILGNPSKVRKVWGIYDFLLSKIRGFFFFVWFCFVFTIQTCSDLTHCRHWAPATLQTPHTYILWKHCRLLTPADFTSLTHLTYPVHLTDFAHLVLACRQH